MNEHQYELDVSFRLKNILELDGRQIESVDLSPDALRALVTDVDSDIKQHLGEIAQFDHEYRPTSSRFLRPVVLVARLALFDQQYNALTQKALISRQRHFISPEYLTEDATPYWFSVKGAGYQPQAHVVSGPDKDSSGVWLGISEA